jgi:hypothetical protein
MSLIVKSQTQYDQDMRPMVSYGSLQRDLEHMSFSRRLERAIVYLLCNYEGV